MQPSAGQVPSSSESSDTDTSSTDWVTVFQRSINCSDTDSQTKVKIFKVKSSKRELNAISKHVDLFIYLGFYVAFNTVQVISRRVVGRAEETNTYSSLGFCTVNCRPTASNYQLSYIRPQRWEARVLPLCHRGPYKHVDATENSTAFVSISMLHAATRGKRYRKLLIQISKLKLKGQFAIRISICRIRNLSDITCLSNRKSRSA